MKHVLYFFLVFSLISIISINSHQNKKSKQIETNTINVLIPNLDLEKCLHEAKVEYYSAIKLSGETHKYSKDMDITFSDKKLWENAEQIKQNKLKQCWNDLR